VESFIADFLVRALDMLELITVASTEPGPDLFLLTSVLPTPALYFRPKKLCVFAHLFLWACVAGGHGGEEAQSWSPSLRRTMSP